MRGVVMRSTGAMYNVLGDDNKTYTCTLRGKFRLEDSPHSNPIEVGDHVTFEIDEYNGVIVERLPRKNCIERKVPNKTNSSHVLAANIDQIMLIATIEQPRTPTGFIDRVLVTAESFRIPQVILFNKTDLLSGHEKIRQHHLIEVYTALGIDTLATAITHEPNLTAVVEKLMNKVTLITGMSGVGKSSLLNRVVPGIDQAVNEISRASCKGTHTTACTAMFQHNKTTFVIDTPGPKEWGLVDMTTSELSDYFPEMRQRRGACRYGARCIHTHEPGCAVRATLQEGKIAASRYQSYLRFIEELAIEQKQWV